MGIADKMFGAYQAGKEEKSKRTISQYARAASAGDTDALDKVYAADPSTGAKLQSMSSQSTRGAQEQGVKDLQQAASMYASAPDMLKPALYEKIRNLTASTGLMSLDKLPATLDTPELQSNFGRFISSLAPGEQQTQFTLSPGSKRFDTSGKLVAEVAAAPAQMKTIQTDQGYAVWDPQTGKATPLTYGEGVSRSAPASAGRYSTGDEDVRAAELFQGAYDSAVASGMDDETASAQAAASVQSGMQSAPQMVSSSSGARVMGPARRASGGSGGSGGGYHILDADEIEGLGLPAGTVAQRDPKGKLQILERGGKSGYQEIENPDGTITRVPTGQTSEGERNNAGFYGRMVNSTKELKALTDSGYDPTTTRDRIGDALDQTPIIGGLLAPAGRSLTSDQGQQYQQAAQNWIRANLRKESGAAIGKEEAANEYKNYFPVLGDSPGVIAQKARNRQITEEGVRQSAGRALVQQPKSAQQAEGPSQKSAAPAQAIELLRKNPGLKAQFEAKYGVSADQYLR